MILRTTVSLGEEQTTTTAKQTTQTSMWVATEDLPRTAAHPFYTQLNHNLEKHDFDSTSEDCASSSTQRMAGQGCRRAATFDCC